MSMLCFLVFPIHFLWRCWEDVKPTWFWDGLIGKWGEVTPQPYTQTPAYTDSDRRFIPPVWQVGLWPAPLWLHNRMAAFPCWFSMRRGLSDCPETSCSLLKDVWVHPHVVTEAPPRLWLFFPLFILLLLAGGKKSSVGHSGARWGTDPWLENRDWTETSLGDTSRELGLRTRLSGGIVDARGWHPVDDLWGGEDEHAQKTDWGAENRGWSIEPNWAYSQKLGLRH